jgi:hypothetical protein
MNAATWLLVACALRDPTSENTPTRNDDPPESTPPSVTPSIPVSDPEATTLGVSRVRACPDGSGDTSTLAEAAARAGDGGVVVACGTVWREPFVVAGATVTLVGEAGTVLEGVRGSPILSVRDGGRLSLRTLALTGGDAERGGAILCIDASLRGEGLVISDSVADGGGRPGEVAADQLGVVEGVVGGHAGEHVTQGFREDVHSLLGVLFVFREGWSMDFLILKLTDDFGDTKCSSSFSIRLVLYFT